MLDINLDLVKQFLVSYGMRLVGAVIIFMVGLWVIRIISKAFKNMMDKRNFDASLKPFLHSLVTTLLRILLFVVVLSKLGVEMTAFVGMLAAAGLAIGMALSGTLQNFAGGIVILIFRPFKVGDFIEAQSYKGTVTEIHIFTTHILTVDNKTVIIPNGALSNNALINYTKQPMRRVDLTIGIAYGDDLERAKAILNEIFSKNEKVSNEPAAPFVEIVNLNQSSVDLAVRVWCKTEDYWDLFFYLNREIYKNITLAKDISFPFPQMDVHVHQN